VKGIYLILRRAAAVACGFLFLGLIDVSYPHRQVVDPSARGTDSDYIEARGFPIAWFVTEELPELKLPIHRRILPGALAFGIAALFSAFAAPWLAVALWIAAWRKLRRRYRPGPRARAA
jgi:hypothetical protein